MAGRSPRRTSRFRASDAPRVDIARQYVSLTLAAGVPQVTPLLEAWSTDIGLSSALSGGRLPGLTVGPLMYRLDVNAAAAVVSRITWGMGVFNELMTTASDFSPSIREHLDWMEWGSGVYGVPATPAVLQIVGGGDDGFRRTGTRRRIKEVEDNLVFAVVSANSVTLDIIVSTVVRLP